MVFFATANICPQKISTSSLGQRLARPRWPSSCAPAALGDIAEVSGHS